MEQFIRPKDAQEVFSMGSSAATRALGEADK